MSSERANEDPHGRRVAEKDSELVRAGLKEQSRAPGELRVRLLDEIDRGPKRAEPGQLSGKDPPSAPRERENHDTESDREDEEHQGDEQDDRARLATYGGDGEGQREAEHVGRIVRGQVDDDAGRDHGPRNPTLRETVREHDHPAQAPGWNGLIDKELRETESTCSGEIQGVPARSGNAAKDLPRGNIRPHLERDGQSEPPWLGILSDSSELPGFGEVQHGNDDRREQRDAEDPRKPAQGVPRR